VSKSIYISVQMADVAFMREAIRHHASNLISELDKQIADHLNATTAPKAEPKLEVQPVKRGRGRPRKHAKGK